MTRKLLTVAAIDKLKPGTARREIPDAGMPGLYLVVQPTAAKSWAVRYRHAGRTRKVTLGPYPRIGLVAARERAREALEAIDMGRDPGAERLVAKARQVDPSIDRDAFGNVAREFIERHAKPRNRTWAQSAKLLGLGSDLATRRGGLAERWHARDVHDIRRRDILAELDAIVDRGAPKMANRTLAALRKLFNWAVSRDILAASPCAGVKAPAPETSRDRVLSEDELARIWRAAEAGGYPFGDLVRFLILTGVRREEAGGASWGEIDLDARQWAIPAARTKNKRAHVVPLSVGAVEVLKLIPAFAGGDYVFGLAGRGPFKGWSSAKRALDQRAGVEGWRLHDLRRTMATRLADLGVAPHIVEACLNHQSGAKSGVAGVYNRSNYDSEKRAAFDLWARHVDGITGSVPAANVVAIRGRR